MVRRSRPKLETGVEGISARSLSSFDLKQGRAEAERGAQLGLGLGRDVMSGDLEGQSAAGSRTLARTIDRFLA